VDEYWIIDPENRSVDTCRRSGAGQFDVRANLLGEDELVSPSLPGFSTAVESLFAE